MNYPRVFMNTVSAPETKKDIDVQELLLLSSNWPKSELYRAFICMICYFSQSTAIKLRHIFLVEGWWVTVDFYSQCKIV